MNSVRCWSKAKIAAKIQEKRRGGRSWELCTYLRHLIYPWSKGGNSFDVSGVALMGIFSRSRIYRFANGAKLLGNFADVAPQQNSHTSLLLN